MKKIIYYFFVIFAIISILLIFVKIEVIGIQIGWILITIEGCYLLLFSFGKVEVREVAVLLFLGKGIKNLPKGLYFAPLWLFEVKKFPGIEIQDELPATEDKIFRGEGNVPIGMFAPIRIKFGLADPKDLDLKYDPYNMSMVISVIPIVKWVITNPLVFIKTMGSIENCQKIFSAKAIEILGDNFSEVTPAKALRSLRTTSRLLMKELKEKMSNIGIEIKDAYVKPFNFSKKLNESVIKVAEKKQDALSTVIDAKAAKQKKFQEAIAESNYIEKTLRAKARGEAKIKELILEAEAIGIKKLVEIAKERSGEVVIWMKTLATALEKSKYSIIPGGELFGAVSGIKEMLNKIEGGV